MKNLSQNARLVMVNLLCLLLTGALSSQVSSHAPTALAKQASAQQPISSKAVARVNGTVLTDGDLLREMYAIFPYARQHNGSFPKKMEADIRKGALQMIIFQELVYQQAQRQKTAVSNESVNRAIFDFKKRFSTREEYQSYLKAEASGSEQVLRDRIRRSLVIEAYLKAEVEDKSVVSVSEARAYYDKNLARFSYKESFLFQSISIMPPANANAEVMNEARRRAEEALRQAKATRSYQEFGLLAEKISEDDFRVNMGDHKAVEREQLPDVIVKAALAMKPGEVSELIELDRTFTIFRLNGHVPAGVRKFDEVENQLRKELQKEKEERLRSALDASLRKSAKVEVL